YNYLRGWKYGWKNPSSIDGKGISWQRDFQPQGGKTMKRHKTTYPGVFYREAERIGGKGLERVYYIVFKKGGKVHEEKVGRQFADDITPARASRIRAERIEGKRLSRKEIREAAAGTKWTIGRLWQ